MRFPNERIQIMSTPHPTDLHVGQRLRIARHMIGMSQETLAEHLGMTFQQVQKYERGANRISASKLHMAAGALGQSHGWFFEGLPGGPGASPKAGESPTEAASVMQRFFTLNTAHRLASAILRLPARQQTALIGFLEEGPAEAEGRPFSLADGG